MEDTLTRTHLTVDDSMFLLDPGQDLVDLMARFEEAAASSGKFVHFRAGELSVSALVSSSSRVVISVGRVNPSMGSARDLQPVGADWDY